MRDYWNSIAQRIATEDKDGDRVLAEALGVSLSTVRNARYRGVFPANTYPTVLDLCQKLDEPVIPDPRAFYWKRNEHLQAFVDLIERVKRPEERPKGAVKPPEAQPEPAEAAAEEPSAVVRRFT